MSCGLSIVHVVDDDTSFRASATRLFRASGLTVKSWSSAQEFLAGHERGGRGCVVVDLQMPGMNGLALQDALKKSENPLPVVFLTGHGDIPSSVSAMRQGAEDFLTKLAPKELLLDAVKRALARDLREHEEHSHRLEIHARFDKLTPRENEVLQHVLAGQLNKQIAADLGIAERSVKRHRSSIMAKLEVQSVAELARLAASR